MEKYLDLKNQSDYTKLKEAGEIIKKGGLVLFPTETVYGLGANGLNSEAVERIFDVKGRKLDNPINLLVSNMQMVEKLAQNITELEYKLMNKFFPGPLTIILEKKDIVPDIVTAGGKTVGIRMPSGEIAKKLVEYAEVPIAAPSANISGKPSGTTFEDVYNDFRNKVDYFIDGGRCNIGIESTIIKVIDGIVHILRPGSITYEQIIEVTGKAIKDYENINKKNINSDIHYNINTECILVCSCENDKTVSKINEIAKEYKNPIVLSTTENIGKYKAKEVIDIGSIEDLEEIAKNIFSNLEKADKLNPDIVIIEGIKEEKIGIAVMDRLKKACKDNIIDA